jgi:tetratricopeptide (TPR) repeat protein
MPRRKVAWLAPLFVASLASLVASPASAQQDSATAQVLFEQGRALMSEEKFAQACEKFAESQRLGPASGTLLNLGECYAKQGKTASAWAAFKEAIPLAHSANQADREKYGRERVAQLEAALVKLSIIVPNAGSTPGLVVKRDGIELGKAAWGIAVPVDPGPHVLEATAPKKKPWKSTIEIGSEPTKEVSIPTLENEVVDVPPPTTPPPTTTNSPPINQRTIGLGVGVVGVIGVTLGAIFGLSAISTNNDAKDHCRSNDLCSAEGLSLKDSARSKATVSTVFFALGAVAIGGGAILFLTAPEEVDKAKPVARLRLAPAVGPTSGELLLRGFW